MVNNLKGVFGIVIFSIHDSIFTNLSTYWDLFVHTWGKDKKLCLVNLCRKGQTLTSPIHLPTHPPQWRCWVNNIHWWITGWPQEARIIFSEPRNEKKSHWENAPHFIPSGKSKLKCLAFRHLLYTVKVITTPPQTLPSFPSTESLNTQGSLLPLSAAESRNQVFYLQGPSCFPPPRGCFFTRTNSSLTFLLRACHNVL